MSLRHDLQVTKFVALTVCFCLAQAAGWGYEKSLAHENTGAQEGNTAVSEIHDASEVNSPTEPRPGALEGEGQESPGNPLINEEERADLAMRDEQPGDRIAGGALSNTHLTYIVIALAAAVVVLVLK